jgi:uncharacterized membrane protein (UPF0127 family)
MGRATWMIAAVVVLGAACAGTPPADPAAQPPDTAGSEPDGPGTTASTLVATTVPEAIATTAASAATSTTAAPATAAPSTTVPVTTTTAPRTAAAAVPEGFTTMAARATGADGTVCELCLWIAADGDQRARGLMGVTDLGPADGMAFVYPAPTTGAFWMKNTVMPLSIAFFDADGRFLDGFDMQPCVADPCERYPTPSGFVVAVEVPQGDLERLGLVPGATLELLGDACP